MLQFTESNLQRPGAELVTRRGERARIIAQRDQEHQLPIIALVGQAQTVREYTAQGRFLSPEVDHDHDLCIEIARYMAVVRDPYGCYQLSRPCLTEEECRAQWEGREEFVRIVRITLEEDEDGQA